MSLKRILAGALGVVALTGAAQTTAFAAPSTSAPATSPQVAPANVRSAHASLQLDIGHAKAWVGQALPVTLRAYFRGAEGVTHRRGSAAHVPGHLHLRARAGAAPGHRDDRRGAGARRHLDRHRDPLFPGVAPGGRGAARPRSLSRGGTSGRRCPRCPDLVAGRSLCGLRRQPVRHVVLPSLRGTIERARSGRVGLAPRVGAGHRSAGLAGRRSAPDIHGRRRPIRPESVRLLGAAPTYRSP